MNTSLAPATDVPGTMTWMAWRRWPHMLRGAVTRAANSIRSLGPYVAIEIFLPGGTLIALALWAYRRRRAGRGSVGPVSTEIAPAVDGRRRCMTPCPQS